VKLGRKPAGKLLKLPLRPGDVTLEVKLAPVGARAWLNHVEATEHDKLQLDAIEQEAARIMRRAQGEVQELTESATKIQRRRQERFNETAAVLIGRPIEEDEGITSSVDEQGVTSLRVVLIRERLHVPPSSRLDGSPKAATPPAAPEPTEPSPPAE
jgi:hypothetical protein